MGLIPRLERSSGEGKGYPLQYSGLKNSMDCVVHGVPKSQTQLRNFHFCTLLYHYTCNLMNALFLFRYPLCVYTFSSFKISFIKFLHVINTKNFVLVASLKYSKTDRSGDKSIISLSSCLFYDFCKSFACFCLTFLKVLFHTQRSGT